MLSLFPSLHKNFSELYATYIATLKIPDSTAENALCILITETLDIITFLSSGQFHNDEHLLYTDSKISTVYLSAYKQPTMSKWTSSDSPS